MPAEITPEQAEDEWLRDRVDDPPITEVGIEEARELGRFYAQVFKATGSKLLIMPSPFFRTCQTCQPLAKNLGQQAKVVVNPDIYENGGVYIAGKDAEGNSIRDGPGECMSAADIREQFPGYDTHMLPQEGPWYTDGWENEEQSAERAERVAAWLKTPELHEEVGDQVLTLVMHGGFIDILVKAILGLSALQGGGGAEARAGAATSNVSVPFPNTATALFDIGRRNVTCHWLGRVDHLGQGQEPAIRAFGGRL